MRAGVALSLVGASLSMACRCQLTLSTSGKQVIQHAQTAQLHTVSPHLQLLPTLAEPTLNPSPVQVISGTPPSNEGPSSPVNAYRVIPPPCRVSCGAQTTYYLGCGAGALSHHQLVIKQAGQRLQLISQQPPTDPKGPDLSSNVLLAPD